MAYTIFGLRAALVEMGVASGEDAWKWQKDKKGVNPKLEEKFPYGRAKGNVVNDMTEYCWVAYSKALGASGHQIIGRTDDLWIPSYLERFGITDKNEQTLWDSNVKGNVQLLDKWAPVVNDCWVLGGVHRQAKFELVSVRSLKNLWDYDKKFHVVTAREILGLLQFGYSPNQGPASLWFVCTDVAKANEATLQEYKSFMDGKEAIGPNSICTLLAMDPKLKKDIEGFDKSKLRDARLPR